MLSLLSGLDTHEEKLSIDLVRHADVANIAILTFDIKQGWIGEDDNEGLCVWRHVPGR
jgi:hypothetical protein